MKATADKLTNPPVTIRMTGEEAGIFKKLCNSSVSKLQTLGLTEAQAGIVQTLWSELDREKIRTA